MIETFNKYQSEASKFNIVNQDYSTLNHFRISSEYFYYLVMGLAGEAGEVANKAKKVIRDDDYMITEVKVDELKNELGDVLWYLSELSRYLKIPLSDIANFNIEKLTERMNSGTIGGSGDKR
jgi:NTP pyrophosphatase (non-canonical NTP hydrolase)